MDFTLASFFPPQQMYWPQFHHLQELRRLAENLDRLFKKHTENQIFEALVPYILTPEQLCKYGYPTESDLPGCAMINYMPYPTARSAGPYDLESGSSDQKTCSRCSDRFVNYPNKQCCYHWGKLWFERMSCNKYWTCCRRTEFASGCTTAEMHVWTGLQPGSNGPLTGFVHTKPNENTQKTLRVAAIDCEMCFTEAGLEVVKVTLVDICGEIVYEKLIKPSNDIVDYNTKFSGITEKEMQNVIDDLPSVQRELLKFISAETILIGHGVENDLRALRLLHKKVIDTSIVYSHYKGFPYRNSLRVLTKNFLNRYIQKSTHNSAEDAKAAMDLMLAKISLN